MVSYKGPRYFLGPRPDEGTHLIACGSIGSWHTAIAARCRRSSANSSSRSRRANLGPALRVIRRMPRRASRVSARAAHGGRLRRQANHRGSPSLFGRSGDRTSDNPARKPEQPRDLDHPPDDQHGRFCGRKWQVTVAPACKARPTCDRGVGMAECRERRRHAVIPVVQPALLCWPNAPLQLQDDGGHRLCAESVWLHADARHL